MFVLIHGGLNLPDIRFLNKQDNSANKTVEKRSPSERLYPNSIRYPMIGGANPPNMALTLQHIHHLKRTIGNRAVSLMIQAKLKTTGQPIDECKHETHHLAETVKRMPETREDEEISAQTKPLYRGIRLILKRSCEKDEEKSIDPGSTVYRIPTSESEIEQETVVATKSLLGRITGIESEKGVEKIFAPKVKSDIAFRLQRQGDNQKRLFQAPLNDFGQVHVTSDVQRDPTGAGLRTADISVRWTEDGEEFYHRVINSAARSRGFFGVRRASLYQPFQSSVRSMHGRLSSHTPILPPGTPIRLRLRLWFDPGEFHGQVINSGIEQLEVALLRENRVTGALTPAAALPSGSPNRLGIMETATLSFMSNPPATAAAFGGLRWHLASGRGTVTGGVDGHANLTTDSSPGNIRLELRVERGPTAGRVATTLNLEVVDWPVVGGRPSTPEHATASMLEVTGGTLQHTGAVSAGPSSTAGEVTVTAPNVTFNARVSLKPGATLSPGSSIQVGPVQTIMSSERIAVYREAGNPRGAIVAERRMTAPRSRDVQYQDTPAGPVPDVPAPWYSRPSASVTAPPSITAGTPSQPVSYRDQPSFDLPLSVGNGILTETRGSDSFITSIVAIHNGNQVHLKSTTWRIPWNLTIASGGAATGGNVDATEIRFGAPVTTGPFTLAQVRDVLAFATVTDAAAAPTAMLLEHLEGTRRHFPAAGRILAEGLRIKDPNFRVNVTVVRGADLIPPEDFDFRARGHRTVTRSGFSVANGASVSITFSFNSLFDPHRLNSSDVVTFSILEVGSPVPTKNWPFPFPDATTPSGFSRGNGGFYTITGNLR